MTDTRRETASVLRKVYVCYFLSGALGLVYQVLWLRKLLLVFGSTVHAVSTVLTVFFGGLALGSWLFGRIIDRREGAGLRWYGYLEAGVGLYAFITLPLFDVVQHLYIPLYRASGFSQTALVGWSFVCSFAVLLLPTTLLGGTFPLLNRFLIRSSAERGVKVASLYGINTLGAMGGTLLVYYFGLPVLGLSRTLMCAGVLNVGIGLFCLLLDRHLTALRFGAAEPAAAPSAAQPPGSRPEAEAVSARGLRWLLAAFALSGFSAMVYEVAWTRALSLVLGSSIYAFCIMLATFLGGMALGSLAIRRRLRTTPVTVDAFVRVELMLSAYGLLSVWLFSRLPDWFVAFWPLAGGSFAGLSWLQFGLSACAMLVPTLLLGALFPMVSELVSGGGPAQLGRRLGTAYALNTVGGIAGSFLAGFVLIPWVGLPWAIVAAAVVNLLAAVGLYLHFEGGIPLPRRLILSGVLLGQAAVISVFVVVPSWKRSAFAAGVYMNAEAFRNVRVAAAVEAESKLLYYRDSFNATVSVHQSGETIFLKVGGKTDASNGLDMGTQVLSAHIPLLLHPDPKRALVIGLGSGVTVGHAARHPLTTLHCAEIDPAVIEGARFFKDYNYDVHHDPRVTMFPADGRNFLLASPWTYDVIISEPSNPWMAGLAYLFTKEFYGLAKQRLAPGGVMCQWLQLYNIFPANVKLMLKTFHDAFPYVSVWSPIPGDTLLIGSMTPHTLDVRRLAERMADPKIRESLAVVKADRPEVLLQLFVLGNRQVEELTSDITWLHEDDQPSVEFDAPKSMYAGRAFPVNYGGLERFKASPAEIATGYDPSVETADFYDALAAMWNSRKKSEKEVQALERAVALRPGASALWLRLGQARLEAGRPLQARQAWLKAVDADPSNVEAHRMLGTLYRQQGQVSEAVSAYHRAALLAPPAGAVASEMSEVLHLDGQLPWAAEYGRSALSQGGGDQPAFLREYGRVLKALKAWQPAEELLRFAMARFLSDGTFPLLLGQAYSEQERWMEAEPLLRRAAELMPRSVEAHAGVGRAALARGDQVAALRSFKQALWHDPYDRQTLQWLYQAQQRQERGAGVPETPMGGGLPVPHSTKTDMDQLRLR